MEGNDLCCSYDRYKRISIDNINEVWLNTDRWLQSSVYIGRGEGIVENLYGKVSTYVTNENEYWELVELLKLIKEKNPNVKLSRLCQKILQHEDKIMLKHWFILAKVFSWFMIGLIGFAVFAFIMSLIFNR